MNDQGFSNMGSYSHRSDGPFNPDSDCHRRHHATAQNYDYPHPMLHRYPEPSQRSLREHSLPSYTFIQPGYLGDFGDDVDTMDEHVHPTKRYPLGCEPSAYSDLHTSLSMDIESPAVDHHLKHVVDTCLPGSVPPLNDYRQSLQGYHQAQSHNQQHRHTLLVHEHENLQPGPGFHPPAQSIARADVVGNLRHGTRAGKPLQQHSPPQMQPQQQAQQLAAPAIYDMSTVNNISESNRVISAQNAAAASYAQSSIAPSSIPMSNNPPPLPPPRRSQHHNVGNIRQQHQGRLQTHHQSGNASNAPSSSAYHPPALRGQQASDLELPSLSLHHSTSTPNLGLQFHHQQHQHHHTHSNSRNIEGPRLLGPLTTQPLHGQSSQSPRPHSDTDSLCGRAASVKYEDIEGEILNSDGSVRLKPVASMSALRDGRARVGAALEKRGEEKDDGAMGGKSSAIGVGAEEHSGEESSQGPPKKKKKSKMHECEVCGKKFPRPSGLKTHMNTHNNEKPFPCGFPGCNRSFGVRSNAKRHLRTHGVVPPPRSPSEQPYVVGFTPPMIMPAQPQGFSPSDGMAGGDGPCVQGSGPDGASHDAASMAGFGNENGGGGGAGPGHPREHQPQFKLRWMPPSLTSRTNAASLREVKDSQSGWGELDEDEEEEGGAKDLDSVDKEEADAEFGDMVAAERLSIPLRPVHPSLRASAGDVRVLRSGLRLSSSGSVTSSAAASRCVCSIPCPLGSTRCPSSSSSHNLASSTSPSSSATSFATPSSSASISPRLPTGIYNPSKLMGPAAHGDSEFDDFNFEERDSYSDAGSHPYHPSQPPDGADTP